MDIAQLTAEIHAVIRRARKWSADDLDGISRTARNMHDEARVLRRLVELCGETDTPWIRPATLVAGWLDDTEQRWTDALADPESETARALFPADLRTLAGKLAALENTTHGMAATVARPKLELVQGYRDQTPDQEIGKWRGPHE